MKKVQKISCVNNAAFSMNFSIRWLDEEGRWNTSEWNSGNYPINKSRTSPDLSSIGIPDDALMLTPYIHAILGKHENGEPMVQYDSSNDAIAVYEVKGTTLDFRVKLIE